MLWRYLFVLVGVFLLLATSACARLSKEEVDSLWEQLLRDERYEAIGFYSHDPKPSIYRYRDKTIQVVEARGGFLGRLIGSGGGWEVIGQLEADVPTERGVLQLYSKGTKKWTPGFLLWEPTYPKTYPMWEFRLIVRDPNRRQDIRALKSVFVSPKDVLPRWNPDGSPIKELVGVRVPRGEVEYDPTRGVATMRVLGLHDPLTFEVPIPEPGNG